MKPRWLDRRIAPMGPFLALVLSEQEFDKAIKHLGAKCSDKWVSDNAEATMHTLRCDGRLCCIVAIKGTEGRDGVEIAGLLVHEAVHVWQVFAASIGEDSPGQEFEAYCIQGIAQELMTEYARRVQVK